MPEPTLLAALNRLWQAALALPDDDAAFADLSPDARREAHDRGQRSQDRLVRVLAQLVADMANDGAELVDQGGRPEVFGAGSPDETGD